MTQMSEAKTTAISAFASPTSNAPYAFDSTTYKEVLARLMLPKPPPTPEPFQLNHMGEAIDTKLFQIPEIVNLVTALSTGLLKEIQERVNEIARLEQLIKDGGAMDMQQQINNLYTEFGKLKMEVNTSINTLTDTIEKLNDKILAIPELPPAQTSNDIPHVFISDGVAWAIVPLD